MVGSLSLTMHNGTRRGPFVKEKQLYLIQNKILHKPLRIIFSGRKYIHFACSLLLEIPTDTNGIKLVRSMQDFPTGK